MFVPRSRGVSTGCSIGNFVATLNVPAQACILAYFVTGLDGSAPGSL